MLWTFPSGACSRASKSLLHTYRTSASHLCTAERSTQYMLTFASITTTTTTTTTCMLTVSTYFSSVCCLLIQVCASVVSLICYLLWFSESYPKVQRAGLFLAVGEDFFYYLYVSFSMWTLQTFNSLLHLVFNGKIYRKVLNFFLAIILLDHLFLPHGLTRSPLLYVICKLLLFLCIIIFISLLSMLLHLFIELSLCLCGMKWLYISFYYLWYGGLPKSVNFLSFPVSSSGYS